jgi:hypothetical protein
VVNKISSVRRPFFVLFHLPLPLKTLGASRCWIVSATGGSGISSGNLLPETIFRTMFEISTYIGMKQCRIADFAIGKKVEL